MAICLEQGADLHIAQLMTLPLIVSCFSKIQIGFTFLVPAHPGSPGKGAVKRVCVCLCVCVTLTRNPTFPTAFPQTIRLLQLETNILQMTSNFKDASNFLSLKRR